PIQSMNEPSNPSTPNVGTLNAAPSGLNFPPTADHPIAPAPVVSQGAHSGPNSLMPALSIPQYKPGTFGPIGTFGQHSFTNASSSYSSPTSSSLSPSRLAPNRSQDPNLTSPLYFNSQK